MAIYDLVKKQKAKNSVAKKMSVYIKKNKIKPLSELQKKKKNKKKKKKKIKKKK